MWDEVLGGDAREAWVEVVFEVEDVEDVGDDGADDNADEWETGDTTSEVVDLNKNEWEGLEPEIEDSVGN